MEGTLRVSPEKLQSTASSLEGLGSKVNNLTQQMTSLANGLFGTGVDRHRGDGICK